jgi:hypothetical protein
MGDELRERMVRVGENLGRREAAHGDALEVARQKAVALHARVADGLDAYREAVATNGAGHLADVAISEPRLDDKHVRAVEFALARGRYRAIVTVKSKGEVTLVGPFRAGKTEGPCKSFPFDAEPELAGALAEFLEQFLEEAATP